MLHPRLNPRAHQSGSTRPTTTSRASRQKRDPAESITYTLFSIHNFAQPLHFVDAAHSLHKTPGGSIGRSKKISSLTSLGISKKNPDLSHNFLVPRNPNRI